MSNPSNLTRVLDPQIPVDQSIYEESTSQKCRLGTRLVVGDQTFRYARLATSANAIPSVLLCMPSATASHGGDILTISAQTAGATFLTCSASAGNEFTANQYAEGYVTVASTGLGGGGLMMRIRSHTSGAQVAFTLYDTVPVAVSAGPGALVPCLYNAVLQGNAVTDVPVGVSRCAVTTGNYFWLQTYGVAPVKASANLSIGIAVYNQVSGGAGANLTIATLTAGGNAIGRAIGSGVDSRAVPVFLQIMP
jgi:hypothetical protein